MEEYLVPSGEGIAELVEKRSRFLGHIWLTQTEEEALQCIKKMREQHWDATHNVYAYLIKDGAMRYSDDGEPQGTAGIPVLEVLRKEGIYNVCCVVTRYFGGTLLGAGGLVRAYGKACKLALDAAGISCKRVWDQVEIPCHYSLLERVKLEVNAFQGQILQIDYGANVQIHSIFPHANTADFLARITDVSSGTVSGKVLGQSYRAFPIEK
jgi:uncharacterized YigZ family protein